MPRAPGTHPLLDNVGPTGTWNLSGFSPHKGILVSKFAVRKWQITQQIAPTSVKTRIFLHPRHTRRKLLKLR